MMGILRTGLNKARARLRVARAIRILELERTRRRFQIATLIVMFWGAAGVLVLLDMAGLVRR